MTDTLTPDQLRAAVEDATGVYQNLAHRHPEDADQLGEVLATLRILAAMLGMAQEGWALPTGRVIVGGAPGIGERPVLVLPLDVEDK